MKYPLLSVLLLTLLAACSKDNSLENKQASWLEITIRPQMNGSTFEPNTSYRNIYGETFTPASFRFYTGRFKLTRADSSSVLFDQYYLADFSDTGSLRIHMEVSAGEYTALSYQLGIDSARNVSGVQSGALDPQLGMFWTWNSGYIFLKLEGTAPSSHQPGGKFEYHIGGFRSPYSAVRELHIDLQPEGNGLLAAGRTLHVNLAVQMDNFFTGAYPLRITDTANVMTPGELSARIADNFAGCFSTVNYQPR
ncbi:MAG: hypothetical protein QM664_15215 [Flavihumibacter sp.]